MKKILLLSFLITSYFFANSQSFEGIIVFNISYENLPEEAKAQEAMLPKEYKFHIKGKKSRMESGSMMGSTVVITDHDAKTSTVLMDMMGQKMKMTVDVDKAEKAGEGVKINYVDGTKVIAGYKCKKAVMETGNEGDEVVLYYTEEIAPIEMQGFEGVNLKGMPLEYSVNTKDFTMTVTASSINKTSVDNSVFTIPEGYTEMPANMQQMMQQQK